MHFLVFARHAYKEFQSFYVGKVYACQASAYVGHITDQFQSRVGQHCFNGDKLPQSFALPIQGFANLLLLAKTDVLPFLRLYKICSFLSPISIHRDKLSLQCKVIDAVVGIFFCADNGNHDKNIEK